MISTRFWKAVFVSLVLVWMRPCEPLPAAQLALADGARPAPLSPNASAEPRIAADGPADLQDQATRSSNGEPSTEASTKLLEILFSVGLGAIGYLAVNFLFQPVMKHRALRFAVASDLVFYANTYQYPLLDDEHGEVVAKRREAARRHAADFVANQSELLRVCRWWLRLKGEDPSRAASALIALSNQVIWAKAEPHVEAVEAALGLGRIVWTDRPSPNGP